MQESEDHLGGLIQCYDDETQGFLWLCEEHRHEYKPISSQASSPRSSNGTITPITEPSPRSSKPNSSGRLTPPFESSRSRSLQFSPPSSTSEEAHHTWDYNKFDRSNSALPLSPIDPFLALEYVVKILGLVSVNAVASKRKHFRVVDINK